MSRILSCVPDKQKQVTVLYQGPPSDCAKVKTSVKRDFAWKLLLSVGKQTTPDMQVLHNA